MTCTTRLLPCLFPALLAAQAPGSPPGTAEAQRAAIQSLEQRIGEANFACDYRFFAEVEAEEFIFTDSSGGITTRDEDLAGEAQCRRREGTYALSEERIMLYGGMAVYSAASTTTTASADGTPVVRRSRFTDVLVWRDNRWQLIAGHASRMRD